MIDVDLAGRLLDYGARIDSPDRAREQLHGAVALHNMLERNGVAYLADEVGMGKTLVALGAVALFRHFEPRFRVLVIAPRENIQKKWQKELRVFAAQNVRFPDLRVRGLGAAPARPIVHAESLLALLRETSLDSERDFFVRLPSFSLQLGKEEEHWQRLRAEMRRHMPWLPDEALDMRGHRQRKDNLARALCCALPPFDLVIVDEAHNLKHGFSDEVAARNRVLALAMGHPDGGADPKIFRGYGLRAKRVLLLSATPIEETYTHLWNQLDVFGRGSAFEELRSKDASEELKKEVAARLLIRRVTAIRTSSTELTKNQYRREWRRGGVLTHDDPIRIEDDRQRLTIALVQKKVSELLGSKRFNNRFQIGMLASFESFLETTKLKRDDSEASNFDDAEQSDQAQEREGIDVHDLNRLARSHRERFGREMPHPKMDALVGHLASAWHSGQKALVFVRRVASVKELKIKLEESYDRWVLGRLETELPASVHERFASVRRRYQDERLTSRNAQGTDDGGSFFAWYFHGDGPGNVLSGATIQRRFTQAGAVFSTFFEDNHAAALLGVRPGEVTTALAAALNLTDTALREQLRRRSARFLGRAKKVARGDRFAAAQGAAVMMLQEAAGPWNEQAKAIWAARFRDHPDRRAGEAPEVGDYLELPTFFTELRLRPELRQALWPASSAGSLSERFREEMLRAQVLASAARLGHAFIDFYVLVIRRLGSLQPRAQEEGDDNADTGRGVIDAYLDLLEGQQATPIAERGWRAYDELAELARNHGLVIDVNAPELRSADLDAIPRMVGDLFGSQHPVGGMAGQVNQTLLRQFRLPGYPFAMITTDLLQEGEDLHPFCSAVYHYGISWTPSSMEQRIGRIDRVRSKTDRALTGHPAPGGDELLQVYFPHLEDSVEVLQVRRVLERMNTFLRLMHEGLGTTGTETRRVDVARELIGGMAPVERIDRRLETAFPIDNRWLKGTRRALAVTPDHAAGAISRFQALRTLAAVGTGLAVTWDDDAHDDACFGTVELVPRQQPFALVLGVLADRLVVRCVSPIGRVSPAEDPERVKLAARQLGARLSAVELLADRSYDLTVDEDVILGSPRADNDRVALLIERVVTRADLLEQMLLDGDRPLSEFRADLRHERRLGADE